MVMQIVFGDTIDGVLFVRIIKVWQVGLYLSFFVYCLILFDVDIQLSFSYVWQFRVNFSFCVDSLGEICVVLL